MATMKTRWITTRDVLASKIVVRLYAYILTYIDRYIHAYLYRYPKP